LFGKKLSAMQTKITASFIPLLVIPMHSDEAVSNGPISYIIGGIVAIIIMGYLIYTLLKPDKF
jgi:K+-transporting ATPase KdpF subunit